MKSGLDKAKEVADKLRAETEEKKKIEVHSMAEVKTQLAKIADDHDLSKMYNDNAQVGAENLSGSSPTLSVYTAGKSQSRLADGTTKPTDGFFFYKPTAEQFETLTVHILSISGGFYAEGMARPGEEPRKIFNQIISGIITSTPKPTPFVMYMTGKKLQPMWDFGKEASKYTHAKPFAIPMFALNIKLSTHEEKNDFGMSWIVGFEILKNEDGSPVIVTDPVEFMYYRDSVERMAEITGKIIAAKSSEQAEDIPVTQVETPIVTQAKQIMGVDPDAEEMPEPVQGEEAIPF